MFRKAMYAISYVQDICAEIFVLAQELVCSHNLVPSLPLVKGHRASVRSAVFASDVDFTDRVVACW